MPFVAGFLRVRKRRPEGPVDPDWGIEEGELPEVEPPELPEPPPGIWPPPVPAHPIQPVPPGDDLPPGMIWPLPGHPAHPIQPPRPGIPVPPGQPTPPMVTPPQKLVVLALIPGYGWKYVVVDTSLKPTPKY